MGIRETAAQGVGFLSTMVLKHVFKRPAANFPGKIALYVDPSIIGEQKRKLSRGSIVVVGTNGKTTTSNLLADALELSQQRVVCNRTGANLDSGIATALLHANQSDWGVFECDEMYLAHVLPQLKSDYVLLLNLFRDQLDRVGEIDNVQESIVGALNASPHTILVYNTDDPLCIAIADAVSNKRIGFGLSESMGISQNTVADAQMCQRCSGMLQYAYRQYGQLGVFHCDSCDFGRHDPEYAASQVRLAANGLSFVVSSGAANGRIRASFSGAYMVYNLLACYVAGVQLGIPQANIQQAIDAFNPENGRLQQMRIGRRDVLLNLAKNPVGFNQNLKIVAAGARGVTDDAGIASGLGNDTGANSGDGVAGEAGADRAMEAPRADVEAPRAMEAPRAAVAFFINDKEADGHDISWLWDVDFEELAAIPGLVCFAGGIRKNDMQLRLKYAGVNARLVDSAADVVRACETLPADYRLYFIANYTALPAVRAELMKLAAEGGVAGGDATREMPQAEAVFQAQEAADVVTLQTGSQAQELTGADASQDSQDASEVPEARQGATEAPQDSQANAASTAEAQDGPEASVSGMAATQNASCPVCGLSRPLRIVHLFPELMNLYGDGGNPKVLLRRCQWRGIPAEVVTVNHGEDVDFSMADIVFLGGGPDREQTLASVQLHEMRDDIAAYVEDGGPLLAVCGGFQILGHEWLLADGEMEGLHVVDATTKRVEGAARIIDNVKLASPLAKSPVIGFENHAGRTYLGEGMRAFGAVVNAAGYGNNDESHEDGVRYRNLIGTYLHGPLLGKNPQIADWLIATALERRVGHAVELPALDDTIEEAANDYMAHRLR